MVNIGPGEIVEITVDIGPTEPQVALIGVAALGPPGPTGPSGASGPTGPSGPGGFVLLQREAATVLSGHRLVVPGDDGRVGYADNDDPDHLNRPVWLTRGAALAGAQVDLLALGELTEPSWAWIPGSAIYLGTAGGVTQTPPSSPSATFLLQVAMPTTPTTVFYNPKVPIVL